MTDPSNFKLGVRLELLPGDHVIDQLHNAARWGFDSVGLPGRYIDSWRDELRECVDDSPLGLSSLSLGFTGSLCSADANVRRKCADSLLGLFDLCGELKIPGVNMPPHLIPTNPPTAEDLAAGASIDECFDPRLIDELPAVCDQAGARGVELWLEPVNRFESDYLNTVGHTAKLCREINHTALGMTIDFYHMQLEELDAPAAIREAGRWIKLVHVAENTRVEPGPGSMQFEPGFHCLKEIGYRGPVEIEARTLSGPGDEVLPSSCRYLHDLWNRA